MYAGATISAKYFLTDLDPKQPCHEAHQNVRTRPHNVKTSGVHKYDGRRHGQEHESATQSFFPGSNSHSRSFHALSVNDPIMTFL